MRSSNLLIEKVASINRAGLARYTFQCDGCGRRDHNDVVPPGWETRATAKAVRHFCPVCKPRFE